MLPYCENQLLEDRNLKTIFRAYKEYGIENEEAVICIIKRCKWLGGFIDEKGATIAHYAAKYTQTEEVLEKILQIYPTLAWARDKEGLTIAHYAVLNKNVAISMNMN